MKNYIVLDTETTNNMESPLVYDIGWIVFDERGNELQRRSFVVSEIFYHDLMDFAYFKDKIPQYKLDIENHQRQVLNLFSIRQILVYDYNRFNCKAITAHNAIFDYRALQGTMRYITNSKYRYFFTKNMKFYDTLKMSRQTFAKNKNYIHYCNKNGYLNNIGKCRLTAEIIHRYLTRNAEFNESHTGLEDCIIEKDIFLKCLKMDSRIDCNLF